MFSRFELNILQSALRNWKGPWGENLENLNENELRYLKHSLEIANDLAERFEAILQDYFEIERRHENVNNRISSSK